MRLPFSMPSVGLKSVLVCGLYGVLFIPLLFAQSLIYPFITLKVAAFNSLIVLLAALWIWLVLRGEARVPFRSPISYALLALCGTLLLSSLFGVDLVRSLWSTEERGLGLIALWCFVLLAYMTTSVLDERAWQRYLETSFGVATVAGVFAFVHVMNPALFLESVEIVARPSSFLGNPTFLAAYLLPHIFLGAWFFLKRLNADDGGFAAYFGIGTLMLVVVLFMTQTRGALIGFAAGLFATALFFVFKNKDGKIWRGLSVRMAGIAFLAVLMLAGLGFWFTRSADVWQSVPGLSRLTTLTLSSADIQPRLIAARIAWESFMERPLLGWGFENFKYPFDERYDPKLLRSGFGETYFDKPHNIVLEYLVIGGVFGLGAYLALFAVLLWMLLRRPELADIAPFGVGIVVSYFVQNVFVFDTPSGYLMFFLFVAFVMSRIETTDRPSIAAPTPRWLRYGVGGAAILGAVVWVGVQTSIVYANNRQYWMLNYFLNRQPENAVAAYDAALRVPVNPYRYQVVRDFASAVSEVISQGVSVPDADKIVVRAMNDMKTMLADAPPDYFLRVTYGDVATALYRFDPEYLKEAERELGIALELSPRRQQTQYVVGKIKLLQGKPEESLAAMRKAIEFDPQIGDSHFYYALIAFQVGKIAEGFAAVETAERLGRLPETPLEMRVVANQYADAGNYTKAIQLYHESLELAPEDAETVLKLGIVYYYIGDLDASRVYFRQVSTMTDLSAAPSYPLLKPIFDELGLEI